MPVGRRPCVCVHRDRPSHRLISQAWTAPAALRERAFVPGFRRPGAYIYYVLLYYTEYCTSNIQGSSSPLPHGSEPAAPPRPMPAQKRRDPPSYPDMTSQDEPIAIKSRPSRDAGNHPMCCACCAVWPTRGMGDASLSSRCAAHCAIRNRLNIHSQAVARDERGGPFVCSRTRRVVEHTTRGVAAWRLSGDLGVDGPWWLFTSHLCTGRPVSGHRAANGSTLRGSSRMIVREQAQSIQAVWDECFVTRLFPGRLPVCRRTRVRVGTKGSGR